MKLCVIPARGGSKRIPRKNIKDFLGRPLITYSIRVALESNLFDKIVVTTDDDEIARISEKCGAEIPFIRPKELSDDFSTSGDAVKHAVEFLEGLGENYEYICTIYATAPLLQKKYLVEGYKVLKNSDAVNSFSCTSMPFPIQRAFKITSNNRCEMFTPQHFMSRSQDLEESYQDAAQFYWADRSKQDQSLNKILFSNISIPIRIPRHLVQDIDTLEDWQRAEYMYEIIQKTENNKVN